jgi:hypothetical protein
MYLFLTIRDCLSTEKAPGKVWFVLENAPTTQDSRRDTKMSKCQKSGMLIKIVYFGDGTPTYALWYNAKG